MRFLEPCLSSLLTQSYEPCEIILVDNGSSDGSAKYVSAHFPDVVLVETGTNCGFAGGTNAGMTLHLAFSIAVHAGPTCFLVDEALAIGDAYFQQKYIRKIQEFWASGGSIIFVSHDMTAVKTLCDSTIMLDEGKMIDYGEPKDVVDTYTNNLLIKLHQGETKLQKNNRN